MMTQLGLNPSDSGVIMHLYKQDDLKQCNINYMGDTVSWMKSKQHKKKKKKYKINIKYNPWDFNS